MGPIDFSKFDIVVDKYVELFDLEKIVIDIEKLKSKYYCHINYLELIDTEEKLESIIKLNQRELKLKKQEFDKIYTLQEYKCTMPIGEKEDRCVKCKNCESWKKQSLFSKDVLKSLRYETKGKENLRKIHNEIGFKACYICNAQFAVVAEPEGKNIKSQSIQNRYIAKFQFDHFLPKSLYPCFSISLYNLFPICSSCNSIKGDRDILIDYLEDNKDYWKDKFRFKLIESALSCYLLNRESLEIDFIDNSDYPENVKSFSDRFDIKGIYNTQIDEIQELILRKLKYSNTYKSILIKEFPKMFENTSVDDRVMLGTYTKKEGIHKRPLSKFLQDINEQLDDYFQKKIDDNCKI